METIELTIYDKKGELNRFSFTGKRVISIGRDSNNDVFISDLSQEISRFHCILIRENKSEYYFQDLGSQNTPKVNGKIAYFVPIKSGNKIQLGQFEIRVTFSQNEIPVQKNKILTQDEDLVSPKGDTRIILPEVKYPHENIEQYPKELAFLYKFVTILQQPHNIEDNLFEIVQQLQSNYPLERIVIARYDERHGTLYDYVNYRFKKLVISSTLLKHLMEQKNMVLIGDIKTDVRFQAAHSIIYSDLVHVLALPILEGEKFWGFLYIESQNFETLAAKSFLTLMNLFVRDLTMILIKRFQLQSLRQEVSELQNRVHNEWDFIGHSIKNNDIRAKVRKVAPTDTTLLITGETGTGKDVLAHHIHRLSNRKKGKFVLINCAVLSENITESELYEQFQMAHGGTLFLNEVSELSKSIQAKLLSVVEHKKVRLPEVNKEVSVNVRIITATNKNLEEEIKAGRFREDLYARLNMINIHIPPLRVKKEDIPILTGYFLYLFRAKHNRNIVRLSKTFLKHLEKYDWPRNIRELKQNIERAVILSESNALAPRLLKIPTNNGMIQSLAEVEKAHIYDTLQRLRGNKTETYKALKIAKQTLFNKLKEYESKNS